MSSLNPHDSTRLFLRSFMLTAQSRVACIAAQPYVVLDEAPVLSELISCSAPYRLQVGAQHRFVRHAEELSLAYRQLSEGGARSVLLESIIPGQGFWTLGVVEDGQYTAQGTLDLDWADEVHQFPMGVSFPGRLGRETVRQLSEVIQELTATLELEDGPLCLEWVESRDSGCFHLLDRVENALSVLKAMKLVPYSMPSGALVVRWLRAPSGIVERIEGEASARALASLDLTLAVGDRVGHLCDIQARDAVGYVLASAITLDEVNFLAQRALDAMVIHTKTLF